MRAYLLVYRFAIINIVGFALLGVAASQGLIGMLLEAERTRLSIVIFIVFLAGLGICANKVVKASRELNKVKGDDPEVSSKAREFVGGRPDIMAEALKAKLFSRIEVVRQFASALVVLGLIGTVVGFIIALSGVTPEVTGDIASIKPMVSTLISGMSVALYTTLEGAIFGLWLTVNHRLLSTGTATLYSEILALNGRL